MTPSFLSIWWQASRPKTLFAAAAPVIMGTAMAWRAGLFHPPAALAALAGALLIQVGTNFANDYFDGVRGVDREGRRGPQRVVQAGLVTPRQMRRAIAAVFTAAALVGLYLVWRGGVPILAIGLASLLSGLLYTAGPSPLATNGTADLFVLAFFGPVAVGGTYYVQALEIDGAVLAAGIAPGLLSTAILAVNNLRDIETDRAAGRRTLAVRFGAAFGRLEYLCCLVGALLVPPALLAAGRGGPWLLLPTIVLLPALPAIRTVFRQSTGNEMNRTLALTGKILFLFSLLFALGWALGGDDGKKKAFPESWFGTWRGRCANVAPGNRTGRPFPMELQVGPTGSPNRYRWTIVYGAGKERQVRAYELIAVDRKKGAWRIDEKNSIVLDAFLVGPTLFQAFTVQKTLLQVRFTRAGDALDVEMASYDLEKDRTTGGRDCKAPPVTVHILKAVQQGRLTRTP